MEDNEYDLPENKQVAVWLLGIMVSGFATSLFGWWIFGLGMAVTSIASLIVYKQKKPTKAATLESNKSKNSANNSCSHYNRK